MLGGGGLYKVIFSHLYLLPTSVFLLLMWNDPVWWPASTACPSLTMATGGHGVSLAS